MADDNLHTVVDAPPNAPTMADHASNGPHAGNTPPHTDGGEVVFFEVSYNGGATLFALRNPPEHIYDRDLREIVLKEVSGSFLKSHGKSEVRDSHPKIAMLFDILHHDGILGKSFWRPRDIIEVRSGPDTSPGPPESVNVYEMGEVDVGEFVERLRTCSVLPMPPLPVYADIEQESGSSPLHVFAVNLEDISLVVLASETEEEDLPIGHGDSISVGIAASGAVCSGAQTSENANGVVCIGASAHDPIRIFAGLGLGSSENRGDFCMWRNRCELFKAQREKRKVVGESTTRSRCEDFRKEMESDLRIFSDNIDGNIDGDADLVFFAMLVSLGDDLRPAAGIKVPGRTMARSLLEINTDDFLCPWVQFLLLSLFSEQLDASEGTDVCECRLSFGFVFAEVFSEDDEHECAGCLSSSLRKWAAEVLVFYALSSDFLRKTAKENRKNAIGELVGYDHPVGRWVAEAITLDQLSLRRLVVPGESSRGSFRFQLTGEHSLSVDKFLLILNILARSAPESKAAQIINENLIGSPANNCPGLKSLLVLELVDIEQLDRTDITDIVSSLQSLFRLVQKSFPLVFTQWRKWLRENRDIVFSDWFFRFKRGQAVEFQNLCGCLSEFFLPSPIEHEDNASAGGSWLSSFWPALFARYPKNIGAVFVKALDLTAADNSVRSYRREPKPRRFDSDSFFLVESLSVALMENDAEAGGHTLCKELAASLAEDCVLAARVRESFLGVFSLPGVSLSWDCPQPSLRTSLAELKLLKLLCDRDLLGFLFVPPFPGRPAKFPSELDVVADKMRKSEHSCGRMIGKQLERACSGNLPDTLAMQEALVKAEAEAQSGMNAGNIGLSEPKSNGNKTGNSISGPRVLLSGREDQDQDQDQDRKQSGGC